MPAVPNTQLLDTLQDGYLCSISFALGNTAVVDVVDFTPPSLTGPGAIEQTSMSNVAYHTQAPGALLKVGDGKLTVAYAPSAFAIIKAMMLLNQKITYRWPNGYYGYFWGWIETFEAGSLVINTRPTATMTLVVSNIDTTVVEAGVEAGPVFSMTTTA